MDITSQHEVWSSIITIDATSGMPDIIWAQENLFGAVGKSKGQW